MNDGQWHSFGGGGNGNRSAASTARNISNGSGGPTSNVRASANGSTGWNSFGNSRGGGTPGTTSTRPSGMSVGANRSASTGSVARSSPGQGQDIRANSSGSAKPAIAASRGISGVANTQSGNFSGGHFSGSNSRLGTNSLASNSSRFGGAFQSRLGTSTAFGLGNRFGNGNSLFGGRSFGSGFGRRGFFGGGFGRGDRDWRGFGEGFGGCWSCGWGWGDGWGLGLGFGSDWGWGGGWGLGLGLGWDWDDLGYWGPFPLWDPYWPPNPYPFSLNLSYDPYSFGDPYSSPPLNYDSGQSYNNSDSNDGASNTNQGIPASSGPPTANPMTGDIAAATPPVLLYFNAGTVSTAGDYFFSNNQLHYTLENGDENVIDMNQLDLQRTVDENAKRGVQFTLKANPNNSNEGPNAIPSQSNGRT
jgi:hypothetical protein